MCISKWASHKLPNQTNTGAYLRASDIEHHTNCLEPTACGIMLGVTTFQSCGCCSRLRGIYILASRHLTNQVDNEAFGAATRYRASYNLVTWLMDATERRTQTA
jgi:hypothetical protein